MHHTKEKGDSGVGFVIADLMKNGIQVCIPISEHQPYDLVAVYPNGEMKRIQVKHRKARSTGTIEIPFRSSYSDSNGVHMKDVEKDDFDLYADYCPDTGGTYYFNHNRFGSCLSLRLEKPKNNQVKGVKLAKDFLCHYQAIAC